ncbi:MAG: alpha/beta hydrolase [Bacteroidia bacterium]|nr:alpha/beta hydrolase [Bacteroidia bacterium]
MNKRVFVFLFSLYLSIPLFGQRNKILPAVNTEGVAATHTDVAYGNHERNVLDIWLAESETPTPLVVYIHGGGFMNGDKSRIYESEDIAKFLKSGISFASINYRFMLQQEERLPGCMKDSRRALQFLRVMAEDWNIDKDRIGAYGGSAGAGTSLWLGLHDEMADPDNEDPVLQESSRLKVVGALATQATYDFTKWQALLKMEGASEQETQVLLQQGAFALGFKTIEDMESEAGKELRADVDFLSLISEDDPPVFVYNGMRGGEIDPLDRGHVQHHPFHAIALKEALEKIDHPSLVYAPKIGVEPPEEEQMDLVEFFSKYLSE